MRGDALPGEEPRLSGDRIIPVCVPLLAGNEARYVMDCIESNWISSAGSYINRFEQEFSALCGAKYGVACSSGTAALHLALAAIGVGTGDEVIIPTFTMISTAFAATYAGASIVLVDAERETWNIDCDRIEEKITDRTKAIVPVHTYGNPAVMDRILALARNRGLYVVEDAAEAHGAEYKGARVGGLGDAGCFSFYANKIVTMGEGGMLVTSSTEIAERARRLRDVAFSDERRFYHTELGFNYRLTNLQAAVGVAQLERFDELVRRRIENGMLYTSLLKGTPGLTLMPETSGARSVFWMYSILVEDDFPLTRDQLRQRLADDGIETRSFFIPMHLQPMYSSQHEGEEYPTAEELCRRGMYLPSGSGLTEEEIALVAGTIGKCAR